MYIVYHICGSVLYRGHTRDTIPVDWDGERRAMPENAKFWFRYISTFVLVTVLVTGLLQFIEWVASLLKESVNPFDLAAGGICAFFACLKVKV